MDLSKLFGKRNFVTLDPSWDAETPENRAEFLAKGEVIFYNEFKGQRGMVYSYSWTEIAVILPTRAARRLVKLMGSELTLLQHADTEMCYKADAKHAEVLVRFIKPKSCRQLTEAHKAVLSARLATNRYKRGQKPLSAVGSAAGSTGSEISKGDGLEVHAGRSAAASCPTRCVSCKSTSSPNTPI